MARLNAGAVHLLLVIVLMLIMSATLYAQPVVAPLSGTVIDSSTGLPLANATIAANGPTSATTSANRNGRFSFPKLQTGLYTLTARAGRSQSALSHSVTVLKGASVTVTLNLQRVAVGQRDLRTIGTTSTNASGPLEKSIGPRSIGQLGASHRTRALSTRLRFAVLPGIVNSGSDAAAPTDDLSLNFRGIGNLETLTLIDGHPVAYGLPGQYTFDISPAPLFRDVLAVYGSGADQFYPVNAIGGVFDFQTINPTLKPHSTLQQQFGTFNQTGTTFTTTGTVNGMLSSSVHKGWTVRLNTHSLYSYGASQDPGSLDPALRQSAFYNVDESTNARTFLGKLTIPLGTKTNVLLSGLTENFYDSKTGNGDLDFRTYADALQFGNTNAGTNASPATYSLFSNNPAYAFGTNSPLYIKGNGTPAATNYTVNCQNGTLALTNGAGTPSGSYNPNVIGRAATVAGPDGKTVVGTLAKSACVTPQRYATVDSGLNGAVPLISHLRSRPNSVIRLGPPELQRVHDFATDQRIKR